MIYGMAGAGDGAGCGAGMVRYPTAVRLPLRDLPNGAKRQIWRDRQIQAQAYNWGVAEVLSAHYRGERIPSPRNHSIPLTQLRHKTGSAHSLLLQRGGHWSAVDAVKKWSKRRNQVVYAQRKAVEGTDKALNTLSVFAAKKPDRSAVLAQTGAMAASVERCRDAQRRRVELIESSDGNALHLRETPPDRGLVEMGVDERAVMIAAAVEGSRRHTKQQRRRQNLLAKNTDVRVNHQLHVAKAVVTTPEVRKVVLEDTNATNMTASAQGTKTFPTRGSAAKRGLNRSLAESAPARQRTFIERAAVIASVATERVNPAYTSLTCFVCGTLGQRETQALFWCPECDSYTHADVQATATSTRTKQATPGCIPQSGMSPTAAGTAVTRC